jgi:hypothetical protein
MLTGSDESRVRLRRCMSRAARHCDMMQSNHLSHEFVADDVSSCATDPDASRHQRSRCGMPRPCQPTVFDQYRLIGGALAQRTSREPGRNRCEGLVLPFAGRYREAGLACWVAVACLRDVACRALQVSGAVVGAAAGWFTCPVVSGGGLVMTLLRDAAARLLDIDLGGDPCRRDVCCAKVRVQSTPVMIEIAALEIILKVVRSSLLYWPTVLPTLSQTAVQFRFDDKWMA